MLHEIMRAPDWQSALEDIERFSQEFEAKYPKAANTLTKDQDELLTLLRTLRRWCKLAQFPDGQWQPVLAGER